MKNTQTNLVNNYHFMSMSNKTSITETIQSNPEFGVIRRSCRHRWMFPTTSSTLSSQGFLQMCLFLGCFFKKYLPRQKCAAAAPQCRSLGGFIWSPTNQSNRSTVEMQHFVCRKCRKNSPFTTVCTVFQYHGCKWRNCTPTKDSSTLPRCTMTECATV